MRITFKGSVQAMTAAQQINGRNGVINKCTMFVSPTMFDPNTGEPTYGDFEQSMPIEVIGDDRIAEVQQLAQGQFVTITADLRGRSTYDQNNQSIKGFLSLSLVRLATDAPQVQQPQPQNQPQPGQTQAAPTAPVQSFGGQSPFGAR